MATEITIPHLGYTMKVAKIVKWYKSIGDYVEVGDLLLEIETDKVTYAIESQVNGVIKAILANVGDERPVGDTVAIIADAEEAIEMDLYEKENVKVQKKEVMERKRKVEPTYISATKESRISASPLAKKIAKEKGIDLSHVKLLGRSGRIRKADVERYLAAAKPTKTDSLHAIAADVSQVIPMTSMRQTIARRLTKSFHERGRCFSMEL